MFRELLSRVNELKGSETDRFLKFFAILNTLMEEKGLGRIIIVGGFAAEIYSGRSYRTGDVDIVVEGNVELVKEILSRFSDRGMRIFLPRVREISEKGIDIVGNVYSGGKVAKINVDEKYHVYVASPEDIIINYLEAWKFWNSIEDRNKAILVYCVNKENLDLTYLTSRATEKNVKDYLEKVNEFNC